MKKLCIVFALFPFLLSCQSESVKPVALPSDPALQNSMQGLKGEMDRLLPVLVDPGEYKKPENSERIRQGLSNIERISKNVSHSPIIKNQDPTLNFLARGFVEEIRRSNEAYQQGQREYARGSLLNVTAYCMECHTRTTSGPSFQSPEIEKTLKSLRPLDRGEYLLSTHQFDAALKEFDAVIRAGVVEGTNFFDLDRATRLALAITVRFKMDPASSQKIVEDLLSAKNVPYYMKANGQAWKQSIQEWKKDKKKDSKKDSLQLCQDLVQRAQLKAQGRDDRAGDIEMMRAQAILHQLLMTDLKPDRKGQALYLGGVTYSVVRDLAMWSLDEDYFEDCIRKVPHSKWSAACYSKLEESVLMGYTGSAGTSVPKDVQTKLDELQKLAM